MPDKFQPLTRLFCNVACARKDCTVYPSEPNLKMATVIRMTNLRSFGCGYKPRKEQPKNG